MSKRNKKRRNIKKKQRRMKKHALEHDSKLKVGTLVQFNNKILKIKNIKAGILELENGFCVSADKVEII